MVDNDKSKKLGLADLVGISKLLDTLVEQGNLTSAERDKVAQRILRDNGFTERESALVGSGLSSPLYMSKNALPEVVQIETSGIIHLQQEDEYISLTKLAGIHSQEAPGYVIQSWLRSGTTLAFLDLWERENNPNYCENAYVSLVEKKKAASFTITPKIWIEQTKASGLVSKQGRNGGTYAHPMIACEFASWLAPEFKMLLLKMSLFREQLKNS